MRAGLLSDPRVVVALRTLFVPVHMTALNTAHCMHDPRDEALLKEVLQERGEGDLGRPHDPGSCARRAKRSKRCAVKAISSGMAERYQKVSVTLAWPR